MLLGNCIDCGDVTSERCDFCEDFLCPSCAINDYGDMICYECKKISEEMFDSVDNGN